MKFNFALLLALFVAIAGCGKSEEEKKKEEAEKAVAKGQAQLAAMQIENTQRNAVMEGLNYMAGMKSFLSEYYSSKGKCLSSTSVNQSSTDYEYAQNLSKSILDEAKYLKTFTFKNDCTINVTFFDSAFTPDLNGEVLILKMTPTSSAFMWQCSFSGTNKKDIPSSCK